MDDNAALSPLAHHDSARLPSSEVSISVLGPVRIRAGQQDTSMRPLERALLVRLSLAHGRPVPDWHLAEDLWGHSEIANPAPRLRVVVSRMRAALGPYRDAVTRSSAGYRTTIRAVDLETAELAARRLYAAQRAGRHDTAHDAANEALRQWHGPTLACLVSVPFIQSEMARLDEWRLDLLEARFATASRLDADAEWIPELATLVAQHPLREPLARAYALALYRAGRQTTALDCLQRLRGALAHEYGVNPAPDTEQLLLSILRHDPALRPARPTSLCNAS